MKSTLETKTSPFLKEQINNLRFRLKLVRRMQFLGVLEFHSGLTKYVFIYIEYMSWANACFAAAMILFSASLVISLIEILRSTVRWNWSSVIWKDWKIPTWLIISAPSA